MPQIRYIFADMDNTLLDSHKKISPRTIARLKQLQQEDGVRFGVATGRDPATVFPLLQQTGLDAVTDAAVMNNGVETCLIRQRQWIRFPYVSREQIASLLACYAAWPGVTVAFHNREVFYATKATPDAIRIQRINGRQQLHNPLEDSSYEPTPRLMLMSDDRKPLPDALLNDARARQFAGLRSVLSEPNYYEYFCAQASKVRGIASYVQQAGGSLAEVIAFGDSDNDVEMLQSCVIGAAMANSTAAARQAAGTILAYSCDEEGIYQYLCSHADLFHQTASE